MSEDTINTTGGGDPSGGEHTDAIIGKVIDGCKVVRKLGQGGMGVVYLAQHESLEQDFVLKILNPALTGSEETIERFFREAQACAQLNHPGIVAIQNVGQEGDYFFIRMEYVEGETLEDVLKTAGQVEWREATRLILDTADALSHAHQKGMIHRDIKPENIMLTPEGLVKVMDFGLAKHVHSSAKVSVTGQIVGTPFFMSPEQAGGKPTDARSDIYSLGVTLYYLVTGVKPFNGKNLQEIFLKHFFYAPESPKIYNESLPDSLCEVVKRCLKKKKKERYQSAKGMAHDLRQILEDPDAPLAEEGAGGGEGAPAAAQAAPRAAPADAFEDGDATIVATAQPDPMGDATVRVGGVELDDATVQVGGDADATVQVGGGDGSDDATINMGTASQVIGGDATVNLANDDDDEPAHAGLDLPPHMIAAMTGGGGAEANAEVEAARAKRKKKLILIAAAVILPLLGVLFLNVKGAMEFAGLEQRVDEVRAKEGHTSDELQVVADELRQFIDTNPLCFLKLGAARKLAQAVDQEATRLRKEEQLEEEQRKREQEQERRKKERLEKLEGHMLKADQALGELAGVRDRALRALQQNKPSEGLWDAYMGGAKAFLAEFGPLREEFPELEQRIERVGYPVIVTTEPSDAAVYIEGRSQPETSTPGVVWARPNMPLKIQIEKRGFEVEEATVTATDLIAHHVDLRRQERRAPLELGQIEARVGIGTVAEPILPIHPVSVARSRDGIAYFVDHTGLLRAYSLKTGKPMWTCPNGPNCLDEQGHERHRIGRYGDPTPRLQVVDGKVVIASSLRGTVSAHDPLTGLPMWPENDLGAAVTSPPVYKPVFKLIAVGTARDLVLMSAAGQVEWRFPVENAIVSAPYFWGDRFCIVGATDNRVYSLDWRAHKLVNRIDLGSDVVVGPVPVGRSLGVGTSSGEVHLLSVGTDGSLTRTRLLGKATGEPVVGIAVSAGAVFYSTGREVHAVDEQGQPLWQHPFEAPKRVTAPVLPLSGGDQCYVGCANGTLYALDVERGEPVWRFSTGVDHPMRQPPFILDNELFVVGDGEIHVLLAE